MASHSWSFVRRPPPDVLAPHKLVRLAGRLVAPVPVEVVMMDHQEHSRRHHDAGHERLLLAAKRRIDQSPDPEPGPGQDHGASDEMAHR
jgi:predicted metal-dependent hydrolase